MGIFGRFEKKVEGAVNGVFARAFKGDVQPVEIAARLQRELDAEAKLMSRDKRLVPNDFTVGLSQHDHDKLAPVRGDADPRAGRRAAAPRHGDGLRVQRPDPDRPDADPRPADRPLHRLLRGGRRRRGARSGRVGGPSSRPARPDADGRPDPARAAGPDPRTELVLEVNGMRHPLAPPGLVIGRGTEADLRINDPGISRRHAEIRVRARARDGTIDIVDLGSTNGITVDGHKVRHAVLEEGSRIEIGTTRMLVHDPSAR